MKILKTQLQLAIFLFVSLIVSSYYYTKANKCFTLKSNYTINDSNEFINGRIYYYSRDLLWSIDAINGRLISYSNYAYTNDTVPLLWNGYAYQQKGKDSLITYHNFYKVLNEAKELNFFDPLAEFFDIEESIFQIFYGKYGNRSTLYYSQRSEKYNCDTFILNIKYFTSGEIKEIIKSDNNIYRTDSIIKLSRNGKLLKCEVKSQGVQMKMTNDTLTKNFINRILFNYNDSNLNCMKSVSRIYNEGSGVFDKSN